jgi:hypothetical protein
MQPLIKARVETLLSTATKIVKNEEHAARRRIGRVGMILGEQSRLADTEAQDA